MSKPGWMQTTSARRSCGPSFHPTSSLPVDWERWKDRWTHYAVVLSDGVLLASDEIPSSQLQGFIFLTSDLSQVDARRAGRAKVKRCWSRLLIEALGFTAWLRQEEGGFFRWLAGRPGAWRFEGWGRRRECECGGRICKRSSWH
jgi:hypothetical protein